MKRLLKIVLLTIGLCLLTPAVQAQVSERAYAPENLRTLSYGDQVRVISLEYSEQSAGRRIPDDQLRFYIDQVNRSNWGFSRIKQDIAQSLGGGDGRPPVGPGNPGPATIRCESRDYRPNTCRTPWQGHSRLVRQLSSAKCEEGRSWQSQPGQVYVGNGCSGEFARAQIRPPVAGTIRCESRDYRPNTCKTPWRGHSRLVRQLSGARCEEGRSWQSQPGQVYVGNGCSGEFAARGGGGVVPPRPPTDYSVTCTSPGGRHANCAWNQSYGRPYVIERLPMSAACVEGRTWGTTGGIIWVSHGCRARFGAR
jgi:hypothetical protein